MMTGSNLRKVEDLAAELDALSQRVEGLGHRVAEPNFSRQPADVSSAIYQSLVNEPLVDYLFDLRDCLVHYRSFATSDNAYVVEEGVESAAEIDAYAGSMARASFRRVEGNVICVNVLLPDHIFETNSNGGTYLAKFTYEERWNLVSTVRNFAKLTVTLLEASLRYLIEMEKPLFAFSARKRRV